MSDLKQILRDRGIRQKAVAERLGVSEATVSQWLGEQGRVPAEQARAIADKFGIEPELIRPDLWPAPAATEAA